MVSALALFSAVALLSGACSAAPTDEASAAPAQGPGGLARRFEQIEQACFQEAQFTAEETSTVVDVRKRATEEVGSHNVDRYAPTPEIARGIRSKWNAFTVCVGREAAKLASSRP
ncbi:uncharacterized protein LOC119446643 isoform X2 [Dermacentor silvarum]|uniref:uncharacterized protein LOC119446643 isoform X2 n=1 Tax=Dermacentor silvarum TaxID=543639 RepID=UPI002100A069|nr:uncharacterized protein LOC119446643 isoform X2 [Dermacentor silvarum]